MPRPSSRRPKETAVKGFSIPLALGLALVAAVPVAPTPASGGDLVWERRYNGPGNWNDDPAAVTTSPDGSIVYVTGSSSEGSSSSFDYLTIAYRAATGGAVWIQRYNGPAQEEDRPTSIVTTPDGSTVIVTGWSTGVNSYFDWFTVAYEASTGGIKWARRWDGISGYDRAYDLAVSPDGSRVFVTGTTGPSEGNPDWITQAYDVASGATLWTKRYDNHGNYDAASRIAVAPDGLTIFVAGGSERRLAVGDVFTIAYDAATGSTKWARRFKGPGEGSWGGDLTISPDGSMIFVTGSEAYGFFPFVVTDYVTIAYDASTGRQAWYRLYDGSADGLEEAVAGAVSPDGTNVIVTGSSYAANGSEDTVTIAYDMSTGATTWQRRYNGPDDGRDLGRAIEASPDGSSVFVSTSSEGANSFDFVTIAYDMSTGATSWQRRYNGPGNGDDHPRAVASSPDGLTIFVIGWSGVPPGVGDFATIAYQS